MSVYSPKKKAVTGTKFFKRFRICTS